MNGTDRAINAAVVFYPYDESDDLTLPCMQVGDVQVYAYLDDGMLRISLDYGKAVSEIPTTATANGVTVWDSQQKKERSPERINGYRVVASVLLWDECEGMLPSSHLVVCDRGDGTYAVWSVAWQRDRWMAFSGQYDLPFDVALQAMAQRALNYSTVTRTDAVTEDCGSVFAVRQGMHTAFTSQSRERAEGVASYLNGKQEDG